MKTLTFALLLLFVPASGLPTPCRAAGSGGGSGYAPEAAIHFSRADILLRQGKREEAEKELRMAVEEDPDSEYLRIKLAELLFQLEKYRDVIETLKKPEGGYRDVRRYLYLGLAYQYVGDGDRAEATFNSMLQLETATPEDLIHVGRIFGYEGKYEQALRFYDRAEEMLPENADLHALKGEAYIAMEEVEKAGQEYREAVRIEPDRINSWMVLAQLAESEEEWEEALRDYGVVLRLTPNPAPILEDIIRVAAKIGDFSKAIEITRRLVDENPDNGVLWGLLGVLDYQVESLEEANRALEKAIEMGVDSYQLYLTLGRSLMEMGKTDEAIQNLEKAISLEPDEPIGRINLALAYFSAGDYEKAMANVEKVEEVQAESNQASYLKGLILSRMERYIEAIEPLETAMAGAPENTEILFSLAIAYERTGQREQAVDLLQKILTIDPDDSQVLNYLGYMWAERGENLDEAEKLIARALEIEPENGYYIDSMAWVYYQRGDYQKALQEMLRSIELADDDPVIFEHLGDIFHKLDRLDEAREAWKRSLAIDPDNQDVKEKIRSIQDPD